jgi:hypothetical protein
MVRIALKIKYKSKDSFLNVAYKTSKWQKANNVIKIINGMVMIDVVFKKKNIIQ